MRHDNLFLFKFPQTVIGLALISLGSATLAQTQAHLESPAPGSFHESGVTLIRGWVCAANRVEISIDDQPRLVAGHGTERLDTAGVCGDTNNGFGLTYNWGEIGDGVHTIKAFADGVEFANANFAVTTLGGKFLTGLLGEYTAPNFPTAGQSTKLRWSQAHQNFVLVGPNNIVTPPIANPPVQPGALLESPTQGSSESGVGLIRGWVCQAGRIEISIDNGPRLVTAYGTDRPDTAGACGDTNNGFGLTYNWNRAGNGVHNLRAFADGVEFASVNFVVTTLGVEFLTGVSGKFRLLDFPRISPAGTHTLADSGPTATVEWSEPHQNFVITTTTATGPTLAFVSAITSPNNRFAGLAVGASPVSQSNTLGVQVAKNTAGDPTAITGVTWADTQTGGWADLLLGQDSLPATYRDSNGSEARLSNYTATGVDVRFFDPAGKLIAGPSPIGINVQLIRNLQELAIRVRQNATASSKSATSASTSAATKLAQASSAPWFSLKPVVVEMLGTGGAAAGELLCALRQAGSAAGINNLIAPAACQSPLLQGLLTKVAATARALTATDRTITITAESSSSTLQQALEFQSDVAPTPCDPTSPSTACLTPAATELQARAAEPVSELPWQAPPQAPPSPPAARTYSIGARRFCFTATADFGVRGICSQCGIGSAEITLQNNSVITRTQKWNYSFGFDSRGSCTKASITFGETSIDTFTSASYSNGRIAASYKIYHTDGGITPVNLQGFYNDTTLSMSGSASRNWQLGEIGRATEVIQDEWSLSSP